MRFLANVNFFQVPKVAYGENPACLAREFLESWMVLIILMFGCTEEDIRLKYINTD